MRACRTDRIVASRSRTNGNVKNVLSRTAPSWDVRDSPKNLPELRKATVDGMEVLLHGRCDAISIDDRALRREVFGFSNVGCGRGSQRATWSGFPMPSMRFLEGRLRRILARYPDSLHACVEPSSFVPRPDTTWFKPTRSARRTFAFSPRSGPVGSHIRSGPVDPMLSCKGAGNVSSPQGLPGLAVSFHRLVIVRPAMEADDASVFRQSGLLEQVCRGLCRQSCLNDAIQSGGM